MSSSSTALAARRGTRLLLQHLYGSGGVGAHPHHPTFAAAAAAAAAAASVRSLRSSSAPAAEEQQQQQQQATPQLSPQRIAAYDFARQTFGAVLDRYNPAAHPQLSPLSPFSREGRSALKRRFGDLVSKGVVISHLNRKVPGFSLAELKGNVAALYEQVNGALASGQRGLAAAEDAVASGELQRLRGDAHARALAGWERIKWRLAEPLKTKEIKIAHARYAQVAPTSMTGFVQVTFKIPSKQVFAAYRRRRGGGAGVGGVSGGGGGGGGAAANSSTPSSSSPGSGESTTATNDAEWELVAGDPNQVLDVTDYWVLERKTAADDRLNKEAAAAQQGGGVMGASRASDPPGARWRLVARLALHPQQQQQQEGGGAGAAAAAGGGARRRGRA